MAKPLTAIAVKSFKSGKARREMPDGGCPGLYLVIQTSGQKSWALRFRRPNSKPAKLTLGPLDQSGKEASPQPTIGHPLTLASARALAAELGRQRARGRDVVADHEAAKSRQKFEQETRAQNTFAGAVRDFIEQYARKKTRRWEQQARLLGLRPASNTLEIIPGGLAHRWRDKPTVDIDGHDIHSLIDETRRGGVPGLERRTDEPSEARARVMLACLSKMFNWLLQHRKVEKNPCSGVHRPDPSRARDRVLTDAEIAKFWLATDTIGGTFSPLLKLLLLTGSRLNEVAGMTREELSDDGLTWNIPGSRTKNNRPHVVPLAPLARDILKSVTADAGLLFTTTGRSPVSGFSKIKSRLDNSLSIPPWRLHDLRRTAATGMAGIGVAPHIVEACLNHVSGAKAGVAGTYNRAAYEPEKRAALKRWADHVTGTVSGRTTKVVALRGRS
ncbi:MAG TPA: tyrosine-type recombinase/integrase [Bradyrhizobium sp.]|jgi:integrase|uniref:tyrosine-type recombinase/integrase n=1 Tax=Bradyrhizobium sp. TaxID=376 RepID=UPI002D0D6CFD|nr:tyrosine-type recombinase/integrase [Bradyrhizobium sp.]HTA99822.1 tyrosine-type recombinase/integrase [Bradyrhizobium sp.]